MLIDYPSELGRLERSDLRPEVKNRIKEFLSYLQAREELSEERLYFYSVKLRKIAGIMGETFLDPNDKDVEKALNTIRSNPSYSEWTIEGFKQAFKKFYKWNGSEDSVKWIKRNNKPNYKKKPDFIITQGEVDLLISSCDNARDKAIFSLLYDTGVRVGELLSIRIKDVVFDDYGMKIMVTGKTGVRIVRAIGDSVGYVRAWLNVHPDQFNEDALLFIKFKEPKEVFDIDSLYRMFNKVKRRAINIGFPLNKRINPHKFRHNRATELASKVKGPVLEKEMGWIPSSRMTRVYIHLSDDDVDKAILEAHGIKAEKKAETMRRARICLYCKAPNPGNAKYCLQCGRPLDYDEAKLLDERVEKVTDILKKSDLISDTEKQILDNISPDAKDEILAVILKSLRDSGKFDDLRKLVSRNGR
jgi:integrase/recombinase XerD